MAAYLTRTVTILRFVIPVAVAAASAGFASRLTDGPAPDNAYDRLEKSRPAPPRAHEILIIETGEGAAERMLTPAVAGQLVLTLNEADAMSLVVLSPILGTLTGERSGSEELLYRFDEEFKIINGNIKSLFDGIRLGSIEPADAPRFISETIQLTEQGKERLLKNAVQSGEAGALRLEKAIAVFGAVRIPADLQAAIVNNPGDAPLSGLRASGYSRPVPDKDGRVRRVAPVLVSEDGVTEHVIWTALKSSKAKEDFDFTRLLDKNGALIFENPPSAETFRSIPLSLFLEYDELDKTLYRLLASEASLAGYGKVGPELYPAFLSEKAGRILEKMLADTDGTEETLSALNEEWKAARAEYWNSLENFFLGGVKNNIASSFEKLVIEEKLDDAAAKKALALRDAELQKYEIAREVYTELIAMRSKLVTALSGAFCIMGNSSDENGVVTTSALLANALLTGSAVKITDRRDVFLRSILPALAIIVIMLRLRLIASLIFGTLASLCVYAAFCYAFIFSGAWLDPLVPALASGTGAGASLLCAFAARVRMASSITLSFAPVLSAASLKRIIRSRSKLPAQNKTERTAIIAVRNPNLNFIENKEKTPVAVENLSVFREEVREAFIKAGAVIIDCGGDTVIAALGSPLERLAANNDRLYSDGDKPEGSAAQKAARLILDLPPAKAKSAPWCFGLDYGECSFSWSPLTGYTAIGRPVARARLLARLCLRYKTKYLVTEDAGSRIEAALCRLVSAPQIRHKKKRVYYELVSAK